MIKAALIIAALGSLAAQTPSERLASAEHSLGQGACKAAYNELEPILGTKTILSLDSTQFNRLVILLAEADNCVGYYGAALALIKMPRVQPGAPLLYFRAEAEKGMAQYAEAAADYEKAFGMALPNSPESERWTVRLHAGAADLRRLTGNFKEARSRVQQTLALAEKLPPDAIERAYAALSAADLARELEAFAEASAQYAQARKLAEKHGADHWLAARASLGLGLLALREGSLDVASRELNKSNEATRRTMTESDVFFQTSDALAMLELAKGEQAGSEDSSKRLLTDAEADLKDAIDSESRNHTKEHPETARSRSHLGVLYLSRTNPVKAIEQLKAAEAVQRSFFGTAHPDLAFTLSNLGRAYRMQGKSQEAKRILDEALAIQETTLGKNSLAAAVTRMELADLAPGNAVETEAVYRNALAVEDRLIAKDSALRMRTARELGLLLHGNGKHDEANALLTGWLKGKGQSLSSSDKERFTVEFAQAEISLDQKNFPIAEKQFESVVKQAQGITPQLLTAARKGLADSLYGERKFREASSLYESVLPKLADHPAIVNGWMNLSSCYAEQQLWNQSMKAAQTALEAVQRAKGPQSERTGIILTIVTTSVEAGRSRQVANYIDQWLAARKAASDALSSGDARLIERLSRDLSAAEQYDRAEDMLRFLLSSRNAQALQGMNVGDLQLRLAEVLVARKKFGEAADLYETLSRRMRVAHRPSDAEALLVKARDLREKSPSDPKLISTQQALAQSYVLNRKYAEAGTLFDQIIESLRQRHAEASPLQAAALDGLGTIAQAEKNFDKAASLYEQARVILTKPGAQPPAGILATVLFHIGELRMSNNDRKGANEAFEGCLALSKNLAPDSLPPVEQFDQIAGAYLRQGRFDEAEKLYLENLDARRKVFGENSADEGWGYYSLANFYLVRKAYDKSSDYGQRSLKIFTSAAGGESEEVALASHLLANSYGESGNLDNAIEATAHAEQIQEKLGRSREEITTSLSTLAQYQRRHQNYEEARKVYKKMEELWKPESFSNPNYQMAVSGLAATYAYLKDFSTSQDWYRKLSNGLQNDPIQLSKAAQSYAAALTANGKKKDGQKILDQANVRNTPPRR